MLASEVNPQINGLRDNGIEVTALNSPYRALAVEQPNNDAAKAKPRSKPSG